MLDQKNSTERAEGFGGLVLHASCLGTLISLSIQLRVHHNLAELSTTRCTATFSLHWKSSVVANRIFYV